ncbi:MAG: hypothetical protein WED15_05000 [Akkermansiaceae bacterium]
MTRLFVLPWLFSGALAAAAAPSDLLRFTNGDQLHGSFQGLQQGPHVLWQRDDLAAAVNFTTTDLRHIVLRGGRPAKPLETLSHLALVNGDRIPGKITQLDSDAVTLDTSYAGTLRIPRDQIAILAPSPLGGRLHYHGPFVEDEWKMAHVSFPDGLPAPPTEEELKDKESKPDEQPDRWQFSGSSWYWPNKKSGTGLLRENTMPDRAVFRFDIAWKSRLSIGIAFHADFAKSALPEDGADKPAPRLGGFAQGDSTILPHLFGNSYVLQIFSSHIMLFRTSSGGDDRPPVERIQINGNPIRLGDSGKATVEIRSNRLSGDITLFINDDFVAQWNEGGTGDPDTLAYAGKGNGIGFVVQNNDSPVKISDVMVSEWNGMPDSARSLQVDEQDIVLLANGTDRFSGKVDSLENGKLQLDGKFGRFQFQLDEVAEIRFARNSLAKASEIPRDHLIVRFGPLGQISGRPISGNGASIRIVSPVSGEMNILLDSAVMLDFQPSTNIVDDWEVEF